LSGFLKLDPPVNFEFECCRKHFEIDLYLVTIRIRLDIPILDGYNHFDHLRKNHLLIGFKSDEQLFLPRLCLPTKKIKKKRIPMYSPSRDKARTQSLPSLVNLPTTKRCPKNHPLFTLPASHDDHKCDNCRDILEVRAIEHICVACSWILCSKCFESTNEKMKMREKVPSFLEVASKAKFLDNFDSTSDIESRGTDIESLLDLQLQLRDARKSADNTDTSIHSRKEQKSNLSYKRRQLHYQSAHLTPIKRSLRPKSHSAGATLPSGPTIPPTKQVINTLYDNESGPLYETFEDEESTPSVKRLISTSSVIFMDE